MAFEAHGQEDHNIVDGNHVPVEGVAGGGHD